MRTVISGLLASLLVVCSFSSSASEPYLLPLAPDHVGLTMMQYPSMCWIFSKTPPPTRTITFTLVDSRVIKPLFEDQLPSPNIFEKNETCHCVNLRDYGISLEPDVLYRSYITIVQDPESRSQNIVAGGLIERCGIEECLVIRNFGCDKEWVTTLAKHGIWYDAVSCLCEMIRSSPDDETLRRSLHELLTQRPGLYLLNPTEPRYTSVMLSGQNQFFLDPANAYSEVLEKSIGGLRMRKEVFEQSTLTGS